MVIRNPTQDEISLIEFLASISTRVSLQNNWHEKLMVSDMRDGGMGGLILFPEGSTCEIRFFGEQASECQFLDQDGVSVVATLNLDKDGSLFELDIWKVDFSKLIRIPTKDLLLQSVKSHGDRRVNENRGQRVVGCALCPPLR